MINPFAHYNVSDMPKRCFGQEEYGKAPAGSLSEQRALQANVRALEQILQLCEVIETNGEADPVDQSLKRLEFGQLFNLYNDISDKLMGTMLAARKTVSWTLAVRPFSRDAMRVFPCAYSAPSTS